MSSTDDNTVEKPLEEAAAPSTTKLDPANGAVASTKALPKRKTSVKDRERPPSMRMKAAGSDSAYPAPRSRRRSILKLPVAAPFTGEPVAAPLPGEAVAPSVSPATSLRTTALAAREAPRRSEHPADRVGYRRARRAGSRSRGRADRGGSAPEPDKARIDDELESLAIPGRRPWLSPYAAAAFLAVAVCAVLVGRSVVRRGAHPLPVTAQVSAAAPPPLAIPPVEPVESAVVPTPTPQSADEEKRAALTALEQGKLDDAVAAGERATGIDPTDADAWRVLGAAYQAQGNIVAARRSYRACTEQAKRGDIRECSFLLQ